MIEPRFVFLSKFKKGASLSVDSWLVQEFIWNAVERIEFGGDFRGLGMKNKRTGARTSQMVSRRRNTHPPGQSSFREL